MADRYWVGGTGTWNSTAGTKWSTTSGGTGGASVPGTADRAIFDANSGSGVVTIDSGTSGTRQSVGEIYFNGFTGSFSGSSTNARYSLRVITRIMTEYNTQQPAFNGTYGTWLGANGGTTPTEIVNFAPSGGAFRFDVNNTIVNIVGTCYIPILSMTVATGVLNIQGNNLSCDSFTAATAATINTGGAAQVMTIVGTTGTVLDISGSPLIDTAGGRFTVSSPAYLSGSTRTIIGGTYTDALAPWLEVNDGSRDTISLGAGQWWYVNLAIDYGTITGSGAITFYNYFNFPNYATITYNGTLTYAGSATGGVNGYITAGFSSSTILSSVVVAAPANSPLSLTNFTSSGNITVNQGQLTCDSVQCGTLTFLQGTLYILGGVTCTAFTIGGTGAKTIDSVYGSGMISVNSNSGTVFASSGATNLTLNATIYVVFTPPGTPGTRTISAGAALGSTLGSGGFIFSFYGGGTVTFGANATTVHGVDFYNFTGTWSGAGDITTVKYGFGVAAYGIGGFGGAGVSPTISFTGDIIFSPNNTDPMAVNFYDYSISAIKPLNSAITFTDTVSGTSNFSGVNLTTTGSVELTQGNLDAGSLTTAVFSSSGTGVRTISGSIYLTGTGTTVWNTATQTNLTQGPYTPSVYLTATPAAGTTRTINAGEAGNLLCNFFVQGGADTIATTSVTNGDNIESLTFDPAFTGTLSNTLRRMSGDLTLSPNMTLAAGTAATRFIGSSTLNSNGKTIDFPLICDSYYVAFTDLTMASTRSITILTGYVYFFGTCSVGSVVTGSTPTYGPAQAVIINMPGVLTLSGSGIVWDLSTNPPLYGFDTFSFAWDLTGTFKTASASAKTFNGAGSAYGTLENSGAGALTINGDNVFTLLKNSVAPTSFLIQSGSTQYITAADLNGTSRTARVTIGSTSTTPANFVKSGGGTIQTRYLSLSNNAASPANTWYTNALTSTQGVGVSGWVFEVPNFDEVGYVVNYEGTSTDISNRYYKKSELIDKYPSLAYNVGGRLTPGLWTWGRNILGSFGLGHSDSYYSSPVQIGALTNWKQVDPASHTLAIRTDGTLWSWGFNSQGQLGNGNVINYSSPIQIGALTDWKQIAGGTTWSMGLRTNGTLWSWGFNSSGQSGRGNVISYSSPVQVGALTNWKFVSTSDASAIGLTDQGRLWTWGLNTYGQLGNGNVISYSSPVQVGTLTTWKSATMGATTALAIKTDGTLWSWGYGLYGQLGNGDILNYSSPIQVGALTDWKDIATNLESNHCAAIKTDGTLWSWGRNHVGQLGNGTIISESSPIQIGTLTNWKSVSCGSSSTYALKTDGTIWAWGFNGSGELGNENIIHYSSPIQIGTLTNWKYVRAGISGGAIAISDGYQ